MNIVQILSIAIPSIISIVGFWLSIYNIKNYSKEDYKSYVSKLVFEKRLEYFDKLSQLLSDLTFEITECTDSLAAGIKVTFEMNRLKKEGNKVKFQPENLDREFILSAFNKVEKLHHQLNSHLVRYYSYLPEELIKEKEFIYKPLSQYVELVREEFEKVLNGKLTETEQLKKISDYSERILIAIFQQETLIREEFEKYAIIK